MISSNKLSKKNALQSYVKFFLQQSLYIIYCSASLHLFIKSFLYSKKTQISKTNLTSSQQNIIWLLYFYFILFIFSLLSFFSYCNKLT